MTDEEYHWRIRHASEHPAAPAPPSQHPASFAEALKAARKSNWLSRQETGIAEALLASATPMRWSKGETVIALEENATPLYFLLHGAVEVSVPRPSLDISPVHIIPGRCWFGEHCALTEVPSYAEYCARVQSYGLAIPRDAILTFASASRHWTAALMELLSLSHKTQLELAASLVNRNSEQRVRARLRTLADIAGAATAGVVTLAICHEELAAASCTSRSTVYKVLNLLHQDGIIQMGYQEIKVLRADLVLSSH